MLCVKSVITHFCKIREESAVLNFQNNTIVSILGSKKKKVNPMLKGSIRQRMMKVLLKNTVEDEYNEEGVKNKMPVKHF